MKKKESRFSKLSITRHYFNGLPLRVLLIAVCLMMVGAGISILTWRSSRAATLRQEGKASPDGLWQEVAASSIATGNPIRPEAVPRTYRLVRLNLDALRQQLVNAPLEFTKEARSNPLTLTIPLPDGKFARFQIVESPMMEPQLAAQFPEIKTYSGQGVDDPTATMRFDLTPTGFHAILLTTSGEIYVDPYAKNDTDHYLSYFKHDYQSEARPFECLLTGANLPSFERADDSQRPSAISNPGTLHTYRLALAATGQYTNRFRQPGDSDAAAKLRAFDAMVTTIDRVNAIYGREVGIRLMFITNELQIIYPNPANDPYDATDNAPSNTNMIGAQNQLNLSGAGSVVGDENYDIGHVFGNAGANVSGGGSAGGIGTVCGANKGGAFTSIGNAVGDPFDVDYVAHEMGHQFGANHVFNAQFSTKDANGKYTNSCNPDTRAPGAAHEPGSGSSIMGYAGICGVADLQPHSDAYFHIKSLEEIITYITSGGGSSCDTETPTDNRVTLLLSVANYTIPARTPFRLDFGPISDPDGDPVTYTWEEYDLGSASPPESDDGSRPLFRSLKPSTDTGRNFPHLTYILHNANNPPATYACATGTCVTGEVQPTTTRTLMFQETVRDNRGGVTSQLVPVNVRGESGPFVVTQPNQNHSWAQGSQHTVLWNPANTFGAPVSCAEVRISLSTDSGITFPIELTVAPNSGSSVVTMPQLTTTTARIKVEAVGNIFFDISDADFTITPPVVSNTNDSGAGSLRQAIDDANASADLTVITFAIPGQGVRTINLASPLPILTSPVIIDGWSQGGDGYSGAPLIELNGAGAGVTANGLIIAAGNSTVKGLAINRFNLNGIDLRSIGGNRIEGCYLGTNAAGTAVAGNGGSGVLINNTPNNQLGSATSLGQFQRNIISGNVVGVLITGTAASGNSLYYNLIGTNAGGARLSNTTDGIRIVDAPNNIIGGTRALSGGQIFIGTGNVISGNNSDGIEITGTTATGNSMQANLIGLALDGSTPLANLFTGIHVEGAPNNIIGGSNAAAGNTISGNSNNGGITLKGSGSSGTVIQGNYLGTNVDGSAEVRNNFTDIYVESANNLIGGTVAGARNVISGSGAGVYLAFAGATGNVVQGNYIGTDASGTVALNSTGTGIAVSSASNNTIGGTTAAARNIISGNGAGIHVVGSTTNLRIQGNYIGTNPAGTAVVGNKFQGVLIEGSSGNTIGGTAAGAGNVISGNSTGGGYHAITLSSTSGNTVQGNFIGTNAAGTAALGNGGHGIVMAGPSGPPNNNIIGGTTAAARNIISASANDGILITAFGTGNVVQGNYIGTDISGTANFGNGWSGVEIAGADNNTVGGTGAGAGNLIAFNGVVTSILGDGVRVSSATVDNVFHGAGNRITGNSIFSNVRLGIDLLGGTEGSGATAGVTANDPCDPDSGISAPNKLQNTPVLTAATSDGGSTTVSGTLDSTASAAYTIDFYANPSCDSSGSGEGQTYLGSTIVNTNASCSGAINVTLPLGLAANSMITATATDAAGNTSEFSPCFAATASGAGVLAFNANAYDAPEGYEAVIISVSRAGSSNGVVTVDYAVNDASASQKSDYSTAAGTLVFAGGETIKTFSVLINDDSFVEGPEFIDLTLSNPSGGASLGANASGVAKVRIVDNDNVSPPIINVIDDAQSFVHQHFHDFLARDPDPGGLAFWTGQITQCGNDPACLRAKRIDVSNAFFYELEYQQTGSYVFRLYRAAFGNNQPAPNPDNSNQTEARKLPGYEAFSRDRARVVGGADLASGQLAVANAFVLRSEFLAKYPASQDGPTFVDALLATINNDLGADLTSQRGALINLFNSSGRGAVLYRLADDNAANPINNHAFIDAEYNRAFVATQYFGYLRRDSDIGGFLFWLGQVNAAPLRSVARQHAMVCSFITAAEYQQRFSSVVTHTNAECQ